jgi:hypothetical protein
LRNHPSSHCVYNRGVHVIGIDISARVPNAPIVSNLVQRRQYATL